MNNQDFKYFFWGTHDRVNDPIYALSNLTYNRFYLTSQDYHLIKMTQMVTMMHQPLICVKLTDFQNYSAGLIDNVVCFSWGINDRATFQPALTGFLNSYKKKFYDQLFEYRLKTTNHDLELQKKLFLIYKILHETQQMIKKQCDMYVDLDHNLALKEYFSIIMPNDVDIQHMLDLDQADMHRVKHNINQSWNTMVNLLSNIDYEQDFSQIECQIRESIDADQSFNNFMYKKNLKQQVLKSLDS